MIYSKYEYVAKVAELRSVSKAAQALYISQPALTRIISNIEKDLGIKLFNRSVIPLTLTYAGERFLEESRRVLNIDKMLHKEMQEIAEQKRGHLFIGADYAASALWLPHILPVFHKEYPGININLCPQVFSMFEDELLKGNIDMAFTTMPLASSELNYQFLSSVRIILFIPQGHPLLKKYDLEGNSLENPLQLPSTELNGQDFVVLKPNSGLAKVTNSLLSIFNIHPSHVLTAPNIVAGYRLAASGLGIIFATPYATRYTLPGMVPVIAELQDERILSHNILAFRKDRVLSTAENRFVEISREKIHNQPLLMPLTFQQWEELKCSTPETMREFEYYPFN